MKLAACLFTAILSLPACSEPAPARIYNTCRSDADCYKDARCDPEYRMCVSALATVPYQLRILVSRLPGGEEGQVDRFAFDPLEIVGTRQLDLDVPLGVRVRGKVRGEVTMDSMEPINAEFAFTPLGDDTENQRVESVVTESHGYTPASEDNLIADLAANTMYAVRIIPLGSVSALFPPLYLQLDTSSNTELPIDYADLEPLSGVLTDEAGHEQEGKNVRLIRKWPETTPDDKRATEVLSVTDTVAADGSFSLQVPADVLKARGYVLQVNLEPDDPWQTTIELDPTRVDAAKGTAIIIPVVPDRVAFEGKIEKGTTPIAAELTFVSDFEVPKTAGDLHDRDWCRSSVPADTRPEPEKCQTTVRTATNTEGEFSVELLPGDYKLYVSPGNDPSSSPRRAQISVEDVVIETQPDGRAQQGQVFKVADNNSYRGSVRNQGGEPLAGVVVRAVALQKVGVLGRLAALNRSAEIATDENGRFELGLDVGYYDLVARAGDGFPWVYVTNLVISKDDDVPGFVIPAPIVVEGTVRNAGDEAANAAIDAYGEVPSLTGGKRLVLLGRTTSDSEGYYRLTLPPEISRPSSSKQ